MNGTALDEKLEAQLSATGVVSSVHWDCHGSYDRFEHWDVLSSTAQYLAIAELDFLETLSVTKTYKKTEGYGDEDWAKLTLTVPPALKAELDALLPPPAAVITTKAKKAAK